MWPEHDAGSAASPTLMEHSHQMLNTGGTYKMEAPTLELEALAGSRRV